MKSHFPTVPVAVAQQCPPAGRLRPLVLVVDDEPLITITLSAILNAKGFAVLTAHDAAEALETCALMPPELLITDVSMPGMNGFDLAIEVKRMVQDCEIIFFTGHLHLAEICKEMGEMTQCCVMLVKPIHPVDLLDKVCEVLKRRESVRDDASPSRCESVYEFLSSAVRGEGVRPQKMHLSQSPADAA
jgi:DNA-binding response OmpR family regulator